MKPSHRMLTGEIGWAFVALSFAWSGMGGWPLEPSYLHRALERTGETVLWGAAIGIPALVLLIASLREYWAIAHWWADARKRWSIVQIDRSVRIRGRMCLVLAVSWAYMFKVMLELSGLEETANGVFEGVRANAIMPIALFGCLCMFWSYLENRRVQRDVRKATGRFTAHPVR